MENWSTTTRTQVKESDLGRSVMKSAQASGFSNLSIHGPLDRTDYDDWREYGFGWPRRGVRGMHTGQHICLNVLISRLVCNGEIKTGEE